jgi:branched-chain amino acid transport system ATP-binding protein
MSTTVNALDIGNISSGYGEALVIRNVAFEVGAGEIFALLGKNGMGKSTLLKTIMGYLPLHSGGVQAFGETIGGLPPHLIARRSIAYTPQEKALFQDLSVAENLKLGLRAQDPDRFKAGISRISEYFPVLGQRLQQKAGTLSGGEQKMLLVSRALMIEPRLMLVDEISEGLQPSVISRLADVFRAERERSGVAVLLIEQNVPFALSIADRYAVLNVGEIVDQGVPAGPGSRARIDQHLSI